MAEALLKSLLADSLELFTFHDRVDASVMGLFRAAEKEFFVNYAKGKGREFLVWLKNTYPTEFSMHIARGSLGSRQDIVFEASVPFYMNRKVYIEFLFHCIALPRIALPRAA